MARIEPLSPQQLYHEFDPGQFGFDTTETLPDLSKVVGQDRALDSIRFGINIPQHGYNLFALGPKGIGKHKAVTRSLEKIAGQEETPDDWCYVHNFEHAHQPRALRLPAGRGGKLAVEMGRLLEELRAAIPAAFESDDYHSQRQTLEEEFKRQQEQAFEELQQKAKEKNIALIQTPGGLAFAPIAGGEVISPRDFLGLPEEKQKQVQDEVEQLQSELQRIMRLVPRWRKENRARLKELDERVAELAVAPHFDEIRAAFQDIETLAEYFDNVYRHTIKNVDQFLDKTEHENPLAAMMGMTRQPASDVALPEYEVNVLVDNGKTEGAPVIHCDMPTYQNLIGRVEHMSQMGALFTNFTLIKPGALHKANGGYLLIDVRKLLEQPAAYDGLKRALRAGEIVIESLGQVYSLISTISLEPEAIPLSVKVVLLGDRLLYYLLQQHDPEFDELFKVMADFEDEVERTPDNAFDYAQLVATQVRAESLLHFDRFAMARLIEHATRLAGDRDKLSAHMQRIADMVREASFWAQEAGNQIVGADDVNRAFDERRTRAGRLNDRMQESILKDTIFIDTAGERVGQINGLSVYQLGNVAFGKPSRITASVRMGKGDVVDIERQVEMGGPIHSKGVLIISSFLASRYATERPLSLSASIVFEQSYGGVEGDSASSTELYALLSALAEAPIRQDLAVTGSINQFGRIQAIGGVNEKIEGFYDLCAARGLTGEQGVLIPQANVRHLMLRLDVVDAVSAGRFHIYPIEHVDQGIELLTGTRAGEATEDGSYPEGSINARVVARLEEIARKQREYSQQKKDQESPEDAA